MRGIGARNVRRAMLLLPNQLIEILLDRVEQRFQPLRSERRLLRQRRLNGLLCDRGLSGLLSDDGFFGENRSSGTLRKYRPNRLLGLRAGFDELTVQDILA